MVLPGGGENPHNHHPMCAMNSNPWEGGEWRRSNGGVRRPLAMTYVREQAKNLFFVLGVGCRHGDLLLEKKERKPCV